MNTIATVGLKSDVMEFSSFFLMSFVDLPLIDLLFMCLYLLFYIGHMPFAINPSVGFNVFSMLVSCLFLF